MVQSLAPPFTRDLTGVELSRQAGPCVPVRPQNVSRFAQVGREMTECQHVNHYANASAEAACQTMLQVLKAAGVPSADLFTNNTCISMLKLHPDSGPYIPAKEEDSSFFSVVASSYIRKSHHR